MYVLLGFFEILYRSGHFRDGEFFYVIWKNYAVL